MSSIHAKTLPMKTLLNISIALSVSLMAIGSSEEVGAAVGNVDALKMANLFPYSIVPYDKLERGPEERLAMLKEMGFSKYAYDWRTKHLETTAREFSLAKEMGIEVIGVWMSTSLKPSKSGKLEPDNERLLEILKETQTKTCIWVGFQNDNSVTTEPDRLQHGSECIANLDRRANEIGCTIALYNHGGWSGVLANQVKLIEATGQTDIGIVYSFHHGQADIPKFEAAVETMKPYVKAIVLNGMTLDDLDPHGDHIMTIGKGDQEGFMLECFLRAGYKGPVGVLGHTQGEDVSVVLKRNLDGLLQLREKIQQQSKSGSIIQKSP